MTGLEQLRVLADQNMRGYLWRDKIFYHQEIGEEVNRPDLLVGEMPQSIMSNPHNLFSPGTVPGENRL